MSWDLDRCAGVLLGLAAGDALGAGYEFRTPPSATAAMIGGGLGRWEPGEWTDDTQMAVCVAEEAATGALDPVEVAERFLAWYRSGPSDVGIQTRAVLSAAHDSAEVAVRAARYFEAHPHGAAGNGSLMRTAPVALAHLGRDEGLAEAAEAISALTHADPLAGEACVLWCIAIDRAVRHGNLDGIWEGLERLAPTRRAFWADRLAEAQQGPPSRFSPNGYVVPALQAAIAAVWHTPVPEEMPCRHLQHALQAAVHIGDDTDTVAAIAGGLLGARWGASALPADWQLALHGKPGCYGRADYLASDLVRLAVLAARGGQPDSSGWPVAESLAGFYDSHWPSRPLLQPLEQDEGLLLANYAGALGARADLVVSLCRTGLEPSGADGHLAVWLLDLDDPAANPNLEFILSDLAVSISRWRDQGKTVLMHCVQAECRTPTVAAAYLAERCGMSGESALALVRGQLPRTRRNAAFASALARRRP